MPTPAVDTRLDPPDISAAKAVELVRELYGLDATATPFPSERDQNFKVVTAAGDCYVLKIAGAGEDARAIDCQNEMLTRLAAANTGFVFPSVVSTRMGQETAWTEQPGGTRHLVRLLRYVPGIPLAGVRVHTPALLEALGTMLGRIDRVLEHVAHPAVSEAERPFRWDLRVGRTVIDQHIDAVTDPARRVLLDRMVALIDDHAGAHLPALRLSTIHNDANDHNILVSPAQTHDPLVPRHIVGLIDFGDSTYSYTVGEVAIACAYTMLGKRDALSQAAHVVRGYHAEHALTDAEVAALFPLICLRLCTSVVLGSHQRAQQPGNDYLSISERASWELLERLANVHPRLAHYQLREACGRPPCPDTMHVVRWLERHGDAVGPVLDPDPRRQPRHVLDLSVGSAELDEHGEGGDVDARAWSAAIDARLRAVQATVGVGRYDEARRCYTANQFGVQSDAGLEWRSVHIGLDLFVPAGTPVLAPLDGVVVGARDNDRPLDYGPTVILRHEVDDGRLRFYTLYGHLDRASLAQTLVGQRLRKGDTIGRVGGVTVNGGWPPHLHLQLITDLLDKDGDFPGVASPAERSLWLALSPDPNLIARLPDACSAPRSPTSAGIIAARQHRIGPSLSVSYRRPLHIVRGWMQHLYDAEGRAYLDLVNNVAHVGHCHPRVVRALRRQAGVLNTNTRYLHEGLVEYAQRLTQLLPEPLRVCFFVCSGTEANELALRLARAHTGRRDVVVIDHAYHGNTNALIELSPYKFNGPGGAGAPPHVHVVPMPDPYRGPYRGRTVESGRQYAAHVRETVQRLEREGRPAAAFFAEPILSCGGQIEPPERYLAEAFRHVREAGGVCVADEVQVGFGRVGTHVWGFETQDAVPDIVTLGKPIGNGHPLGAVVTTSEIAASFANGMEYFNTFGGNPVSCAVGLAVLDVIQDEGLQERALHVGGRLAGGLCELMRRHHVIGDVRGRGLFLGVELVFDRATLEPAPRHAAYVIERMRERGILLSTDGPLHNVLKIKPPLVLTESDVDRVLETLDAVLRECEG